MSIPYKRRDAGVNTTCKAGEQSKTKENKKAAPISLVNSYRSERALRAFGLSASFLNNSVCLMKLIKSSETSDASSLDVVENDSRLRRASRRWVG
jgi:hypothetical protein